MVSPSGDNGEGHQSVEAAMTSPRALQRPLERPRQVVVGALYATLVHLLGPPAPRDLWFSKASPWVMMSAATGGSSNPDTEPILGIEDLYRAHGTAMYRVAVAVVRDHALAEDVVQDSVVKAWRNLDTFRGDAAPRTWLLRITHNTAVSALRARRDTPVDPVSLPEPRSDDAADDVVDQAFLEAFEQALFELDELSRTTVALRELEHLPYAEIAEILEVPIPTVKTRLFRARSELSTRLAGWRIE